MSEEKYLVVRLSNMSKEDFFKQHQDVIKQYGEVDLCIISSKRPNFSLYEKKLFIKESKSKGNRVFCADIKEVLLGEGVHYPEYYSKINTARGSWVRITNLEVKDMDWFDDKYIALSGKSISKVLQSSVSFFGIKEK
jgi:hypothetical protein